jgi:hypothetical protein
MPFYCMPELVSEGIIDDTDNGLFADDKTD